MDSPLCPQPKGLLQLLVPEHRALQPHCYQDTAPELSPAVRHMHSQPCHAVFSVLQSSPRLFAGQESKIQTSSSCKFLRRLKYSWRAKAYVLCRGEVLNSEQVLLEEQLNLGLGLSFMEKFLKSENKSKTLKQQGNWKLQGTGISMF